MTPYYKRGGVTLFHGDQAEVTPTVAADLCLADLPYGINYMSRHNTRTTGVRAKWCRPENFPPIQGDEKPWDPTPFLRFPLVVLFGSNYFANKLPPSKCWVVWDKLEGAKSDQGADAELIWTNLDKPTRIYHHLWRGLRRRGEENVSRQPKYHPHQKPVALLSWLIEFSGCPAKGIVYDPTAGSGSILLAAARTGRSAVGVEIEESYCEVTAKRLEAEFDGSPLFERRAAR